MQKKVRPTFFFIQETFSCKKFFHPNFLYNHANRFLQFLDRNCDEIQDFRENNDKGYLNINIKLIKERYDTTTTNIVVPIN